MTNASQPTRLYVKGTILGYKSLLQVDGVNDTEAGSFYHGKKVAYIYKAKTAVSGSKFRVVWGKVIRSHGTNGVLRAKFSTNLSPTTIGSSVRVMLYPSRV
eukprot:gene22398-30649_t